VVSKAPISIPTHSRATDSVLNKEFGARLMLEGSSALLGTAGAIMRPSFCLLSATDGNFTCWSVYDFVDSLADRNYAVTKATGAETDACRSKNPERLVATGAGWLRGKKWPDCSVTIIALGINAEARRAKDSGIAMSCAA
jgi:hypothetical protein